MLTVESRVVVPMDSLLKVLSQKKLLSPVIELVPFQNVTWPETPDPETPPRPAAERQVLLIA